MSRKREQRGMERELERGRQRAQNKIGKRKSARQESQKNGISHFGEAPRSPPFRLNSNCSFNLISSLRERKERGGGRRGMKKRAKRAGFFPLCREQNRVNNSRKNTEKKKFPKTTQKKGTYRHQRRGAFTEDVHEHRLPRSHAPVHVESPRRRVVRRGSGRGGVRGPAEERREPAPAAATAASAVADRPHHRQARARRRAGLDVVEQPLQLQHGALLPRVLAVEPGAAPRRVDGERAPRRRPDLRQREEGVVVAAAACASRRRRRRRRRDGVSDDVLDLLAARGAGVEGRRPEERGGERRGRGGGRGRGRRGRCSRRRHRPMERRVWATSTLRFQEKSGKPCVIRATRESSASREHERSSKKDRNGGENKGTESQREGRIQGGCSGSLSASF